MTTKTYDAIVYSEGRPVIGEAREESDGSISLNLWLVPQDRMMIYLKPKRKKKGEA